MPPEASQLGPAERERGRAKRTQPRKIGSSLFLRPSPRFEQAGEPFGLGAVPGRAFARPPARGQVGVGGGLGAVVPPAAVPEALEQGGRVAGEEVEVGAQGLLDQSEVAAGGVVGRHGGEGAGEVHRQVEDVACLGFGFQEGQVAEQG